MVCYNLVWKKSAKKELKQLDKKAIEDIINVVGGLSLNPFPPGVKKLQASEKAYRIRVGNYRVIYSVDGSLLLIEVIKVGHRKDVYSAF